MLRGNRRRASLALAAIAMLAGLVTAGCASGATPHAKTKATKLLVWDWDSATPSFKKSFQIIDAQFEKAHPGVTIDPVVQPFGNYAQLFQTSLSGGSAPCVAELLAASSGPAVLRYAPDLTPLNSIITPAMHKDLFGLDVASKNFNPNSTIYGLPFGLQPQVMYYNKSLFRKAGLNPNDPPSTYAQLVADAKKLKAAGITPLGGGNKEGYLNEWWFSFLFPGDGTAKDSYDLANGSLKFTSAIVTRTAQNYVDLYKDGFFSPGIESTPAEPDGQNDFANGQEAMYVGLGSGGAASYAVFDKALGTKNVGVITGLGDGSAKPHYLPGGPASTWVIPKTCTQKPLAEQYLQFIASAASVKTLWKVGGIIPGDKTISVGKSAPPQVKKIVADYSKLPSVYPAHGLWQANVDTEWVSQLQLVIAGSEPLSSALSATENARNTP